MRIINVINYCSHVTILKNRQYRTSTDPCDTSAITDPTPVFIWASDVLIVIAHIHLFSLTLFFKEANSIQPRDIPHNARHNCSVSQLRSIITSLCPLRPLFSSVNGSPSLILDFSLLSHHRSDQSIVTFHSRFFLDPTMETLL